MAPAPGDLLRLSDLEINNKVQAMYEDGFWYNAYVLDKTGSGANTTVLVHFNGYPKSHRRWVHSAHNRVRARLPPSQLRREHEEAMFAGADTGRLGNQKWAAERLLKVRRCKGRREYLVRFEGYGPEADAWCHDVSSSLVEEFELSEKLAERRAARAKLKKPKTPFTAALVAAEHPSVRTPLPTRARPPPSPEPALCPCSSARARRLRQMHKCHLLYVDEMLADVRKRIATKVLPRLTGPGAEVVLYFNQPTSAGLFHALRGSAFALAQAEHASPDDAVTQIVHLRGGRRCAAAPPPSPATARRSPAPPLAFARPGPSTRSPS